MYFDTKLEYIKSFRKKCEEHANFIALVRDFLFILFQQKFIFIFILLLNVAYWCLLDHADALQ